MTIRATMASMVGVYAVLASGFSPLVAVAEEGILTDISEIRKLSSEASAKELPVRVQGVVTFSDEKINTLFIHDRKVGIFIEQSSLKSQFWPEEGDRVEITGVTNDGIFSPVISGKDGWSPKIKVLEKGDLFPPRPVDGKELSRPDLDCDWITVEADVLEVFSHSYDGFVLECRAGSCDFHALIEGLLLPDSIPWDVAKRRVRIRGVVATIFNRNRQMTRRFLRVNSPLDVFPLSDIKKKPHPREVEPDQLLRVNGPGPDDLVALEGSVTFDIPGKGMFLRADGRGLWVQTARHKNVTPGTIVRVEGWPEEGTMKPFLRASNMTVLDQQDPPTPLEGHASDFLASRFDSELVVCEAELLNIFHSADGATLELRDEAMVFRGWLDNSDGTLPDLIPGSTLLITGITQISIGRQFQPFRKESQLILNLRSADDIMLLKSPPWWTPTRLTWAACGLVGLMLIIIQRNRMRRKRIQESQKKAFDAVLSERGRFAREIHDSLAQGLTSVSLQLECVRDQLADTPDSAVKHLETARRLTRESLREARRSIWNLRPFVLGEGDLASALQKYAKDLTRGTEMTCQQQIEGSPCSLPREHESALLRIGQESLTNAVRHSGAKHIEVRLRFGDGWVTLVVKDDGQGFCVTDRQGQGYGLTGIHERVEESGGSLSIDSHPSEGTEVSVTLSL